MERPLRRSRRLSSRTSSKGQPSRRKRVDANSPAEQEEPRRVLRMKSSIGKKLQNKADSDDDLAPRSVWQSSCFATGSQARSENGFHSQSRAIDLCLSGDGCARRTLVWILPMGSRRLAHAAPRLEATGDPFCCFFCCTHCKAFQWG